MASSKSSIPRPGQRCGSDTRRPGDHVRTTSLPISRIKSSAALPTHTPSTASPVQTPKVSHRSSAARLSSFGSHHTRCDSVMTSTEFKPNPQRHPSAGKSYGLLTPSTTSSRSSLTPKDNASSPSRPPRSKARSSQAAIPHQTPAKPPPAPLSPYVNAHISDPCLPGGLIHRLHPCGHKILTTRPEPCAINCQRPFPISNGGPPTLEPFVCAACVELHVQVHRQVKRDVFVYNFARTEAQLGQFPAKWIEGQREFWEKVWENDMLKEKDAFARLGRNCEFISGEPIVEGMGKVVDEVEKTYKVPWPPTKRPAKARVPEWRPRLGQDG